MEIGDGAVRAAPIVGAIGADVVVTLKGLTLNDLFYITTITYTLVQLVLVVWKTVREERRKDKQGGDNG